jgi:hypothetical protein
MTGNTYAAKGHTYSYYRCARKKRNKQCDMPDIPRDQAEKMVLDALSRILDGAELDRLAGLIADYAAKQDADRKAEAEYLREELAEAERRISKW